MGTMDELIDAAAIQRLGGHLRSNGLAETPSLDRAAQNVAGLPLRRRVDQVVAALIEDLPSTYPDSAEVVRAALSDAEFEGWTIWPVGEVVAHRALMSTGSDDFEDGLELLAELTPRLSSEFAIRPFLNADLDRSLDVVGTWVASPDAHVRRLASEGTRPYLPWGIGVKKIVERPTVTLHLLDAMYRDPDEVVRRSVANHLNDLSRHAPQEVIAAARRWSTAPDASTHRVVRHGLRTLTKRGDPAALALQGFGSVDVEVTDLDVTPERIQLPGEVTISFRLTNSDSVEANLAVDYVVHFRKKNGSLSEKVFKLATPTLAAGASVTLTKRHGLRQMTTRVHYAGEHHVEVQINGRRFGRAVFELELQELEP